MAVEPRLPSYGYHALPRGTGQHNGQANAVSDNGDVAVGWVSPVGDDSNNLACYWAGLSGPTMIITDPDQTSTANGVSSDGSVIAGVAIEPLTIGNGNQAFRFIPATSTLTLFDTGGGANGVSANGNYICGWQTNGNTTNYSQACFWDTATLTRTNLGFLPGDGYSVANSMSADGSVIVGFSQFNVFSSTPRAFRWTAATGMVDLGYISGSTAAQASGVSADGSIVQGNSGLNPPNPMGFQWTAGSLVGTTLGNFTPGSLSSDGTIILGTSPYAMAYERSGVVTTPTVIPLDPALGSAIQVTEGLGLSHDGKTIVGCADPSLAPSSPPPPSGSVVYRIPFIYVVPPPGFTGATLTDSELAFSPTGGFVDFTNTDNRRLFVSNTGTPQWMGANGSLGFGGNIPSIYLTTLPGDALDFAGNNGSGGAFAVTQPIASTSGPGCTPYYITEAAGPAANPEWRLTVSDDGGRTWSTLVKPRSIGALGQYLTRLRWLKMGHSRERMIRLECSDPVRRNVVGFYIDVTAGMG